MPAIILSDNGATSGSAGLKTSGSNDGTLALQTSTAGGTATTAVTINTSQNVGLGVTPSAWTTNYKAIQVGAAGAFWASATSGTTILSSNAYYDGTNYNYLLGTSNAATAYFQTSGQHRWLNAPNGTGVITFTQAMTLDASGNLGIGTTSPSARLHVSASGAGIQEVEWLNNAQAVGADVGSAMVFTGTSSNNGLARISGAFSGATTADGAYMAFSTRAVTSGTLTERMRLDASGNLQLGTTSGTQRLNVAGRISFAAVATDADIYGLYVSSDTSNSTTLSSAGATNICFRSNNTERARIDSSGNFLIGTTTNIGSARTSIVNASGVTLNLEKATGSSIQFTYSGGTTDAQIAGGGSGSLLFYTGNTLAERARIDSSGNFLLGGTSISALSGVFGQVVGSTSKTYSGIGYQTATKAYVTFTGTGTYNDSWVVYDTSAVVERFRITSNGYTKANVDGGFYSSTGVYHEFNQPAGGTNSVIFRTTAASPYGPWVYFSGASPNNTTNYFLAGTDTTNDKVVIYSSGTITNRTGTYNAFSDIKLKQDVIDASSQWGDIKALRFRKFRLKDDVAADPNAPYLLGLIAQEAEQVSPSLIDESPDTERDEEGNMVETGEVTKSVKYSILYMKAVVALQEAMNRIEQLEADVATLKGTP